MKDVVTYSSRASAENARLGAALLDPMAAAYSLSGTTWSRLFVSGVINQWIECDSIEVPIKVLLAAKPKKAPRSKR